MVNVLVGLQNRVLVSFVSRLQNFVTRIIIDSESQVLETADNGLRQWMQNNKNDF